jgi:hypothetical protein
MLFSQARLSALIWGTTRALWGRSPSFVLGQPHPVAVARKVPVRCQALRLFGVGAMAVVIAA